MSSVVLLGVICCLLRCGESQEVLIDETAGGSGVVGPTGGAAQLPCDVVPAIDGDRAGLIIWYKQGHISPIYTLDTREGVTSHWSDQNILGGRAFFRVDSTPAVLVLSHLRPDDTGLYRCRVDFMRSPTKNTRLNLTVLIPPERLLLLDQLGDEIRGGVIGPLDEGTEINITCVAVGGRPTPRVSWWKAHELLANSEARATAALTLRRSDLHAEVTCQAVTDASMPPLSETLTIDVNLGPLWISLQGGRRVLVAGQTTELVCQAVGSRPKPIISWWKGTTRLKGVRDTVSSDGNITNSILTFVPSLEDSGRTVSCRASHPTLPHATQEDGFQLEIQHLPLTALSLGANLDSENVLEGSDVYLDCRVRSHPRHSHVYFTHNGVPVKPGPGVLLSNQSLVLQSVSRAAAGAYVCVAKNSLGEGSSEKLVLDVKYAPVCSSPSPVEVRAARGDVVDIECRLDANPRDNLQYYWWFNSSAHTKHELQTNANAPSMPGTFPYLVRSAADYGWLQCGGANSAGRQARPCLIHVLPADKPAAPSGCEVTNVTFSSLALRCAPGHDGGIRQAFLLQIFDTTSGTLLVNVTNEEPDFVVHGITASGPLSVTVRAFNRKGQGEALTLSTHLLKHPQKHTAQVPVRVELSTVLLVVAAAGALIVLLTVASAAVFCCRYCTGSHDKSEKDKRRRDETSDIPLTGNKEGESIDSLDKNPDIIPLNGKISDSCSNKSSTTDYSSIRPLISKTPSEKYDSLPLNCERYTYDHNIDQMGQLRPMDTYVVPPMFTNVVGRMPNLGPTIQSIRPEGLTNPDCYGHRPPYDKVYEEWLKYKNALPLNTSGLLPPEQLMPPELYSTPPHHSLYSNPNPLNLVQMPDLEPRYHLDPRSLNSTLSSEGRCTNSPPVRFSPDNTSVYFNKGVMDRGATLPHFKHKVIAVASQQQPNIKTSALNVSEVSDPS